MRRTTVYLTADEAAALRRMSAASGRSQADLIREGLLRVLGEPKARRFHSMGKGRSKRPTQRRWTADEVYRKAFGRR